VGSSLSPTSIIRMGRNPHISRKKKVSAMDGSPRRLAMEKANLASQKTPPICGRRSSKNFSFVF
jgi:hypothetical protein